MRILTTLTYYTPHISGLTMYARLIVSALTERGHHVTVLTSRYDGALPREEAVDGARVVRSRVWLRVNKGVVMPGFFLRACREVHRHDVVYLHLPQFEACVVALYARLVARRPVVTTYHCDLELPPGSARVLFTPFIKLSHFLTFILSHRVVANDEDYVRSSRFLRRFAQRIEVCYPPCVPPAPDPDAPPPLDVPEGARVVGFVGRFAEEKGIQYILEAAPRVLEAAPDAVFAFAGERERVFGERVYRRLAGRIQDLGDRVRLLGVLPEAALAAFYRRCSVLLLPSVNATESFGVVQVEAMWHGTPVVASDIPGVRRPVALTGMGVLVPPRDPEALAGAVVRLLTAGPPAAVTPEELERTFGLRRAADYYEALFADAAGGRLAGRRASPAGARRPG